MSEFGKETGKFLKERNIQPPNDVLQRVGKVERLRENPDANIEILK